MKLILRFLKPHKKLCICTILFMAIDMVGMMLIPTFAAELMNKGASPDMGFQDLLYTASKMFAVAVVAGAGAIIGGYFCARLAARAGADMREAIYRKSLELSSYDFQSFGTASMTTRTVSNVATIQFALVGIFQMLLPVPIIFITAAILSFLKDPYLGGVLLAVLILLILVAGLIMKQASPLFQKLQKLLDKMSAVLLENITGVRVVRAFNKQEHETQRLNDAFGEYKVTSVKVNKMFAGLDGLTNFAINLFVVLVYWLSGSRIVSGRFQIGDITAIIEYAIMAMFGMLMAQFVILELPRAMECANRIGEVLAYRPQIVDQITKEVPLTDKKNVMSFQEVSFRYEDSEEYTLRDLNFVCRQGETTAIIGGTGSGKSTIASLMLRFNDVTNGHILLGGVDIRDMPQRQLRNNVSYVQQRAWLFSGTIADNLRYGHKDATEEELWQALHIAQAEDFVRALPEGLYSHVAQGGTNFSGGQRQRLSIARAIVKDPQLYIFDDSFSALDFKTDAALRKALLQGKRDKAIVIIAQRVSSIRHADQIVVINEGRPVGIGKHEDLYKTCDIYRGICESQRKEAGENE